MNRELWYLCFDYSEAVLSLKNATILTPAKKNQVQFMMNAAPIDLSDVILITSAYTYRVHPPRFANDIGSTVVLEYYRINSLNIDRFFIVICENYPIRQKVHIVLDGAAYYRAELVKEWAYVMNIDLHYLLSYSPNLNQIERL